MSSSPDRGTENGWGFTMVEVLVALVILTVGIIALGLLSGQFNRQTNLSDLAMERSVSLQSAIVDLRGTPFEDVAARSVTIDNYEVSWSVASSGADYKEILIVTVGPGMEDGRMRPEVSETFSYRLLGRAAVQCEDAQAVDDEHDADADDDDDLDGIDQCENDDDNDDDVAR